MRAATFLLVSVLLAPTAMAACTGLGCVNTIDDDKDGTPDGIIGGTASPIHGGPSASFLINGSYVILSSETFIGEEDEADATLVRGDIFLHRNETRVDHVAVSQVVQSHDGANGQVTPLAEAWLYLYDTDDDGTVDAWACYAEPEADATHNARTACEAVLMASRNQATPDGPVPP